MTKTDTPKIIFYENDQETTVVFPDGTTLTAPNAERWAAVARWLIANNCQQPSGAITQPTVTIGGTPSHYTTRRG